MLIQNAAKCKVSSIIYFWHAKWECPADIHKEIVSIYGNIRNWQNLMKLCNAFSGYRIDIHAEPSAGRLFIIFALHPGSWTQWLPLAPLFEKQSCNAKLPWWRWDQSWNKVLTKVVDTTVEYKILYPVCRYF